MENMLLQSATELLTDLARAKQAVETFDIDGIYDHLEIMQIQHGIFGYGDKATEFFDACLSPHPCHASLIEMAQFILTKDYETALVKLYKEAKQRQDYGNLCVELFETAHQ